MRRVAILGAGVMGSAMTLPLAHRGAAIDLVGTHLDDELIAAVAKDGRHPRLGIALPGQVRARPWQAFAEVLAAGGHDLIVLGVSSAGIPWAIDRLAETLDRPLPILMVTKGLAAAADGIGTLPDLVAAELARRTSMTMPVMAIGGPCIAGELAAGRDTSVVIAGREPAAVEALLPALAAPFYHPRLSRDLVGVEISAAFKNFYTLAIAAPQGLLERQGRAGNGAVMHNLSAAIFAQALAEMQHLVEALGGDPATVPGLAGAGDLYVTAQAGRNGRMGRLLGLGMTYRQAKAEHMQADTVEGAQLGLDLGRALLAMVADGRLSGARLPLARAIIAALCDDAPLALDCDSYHRGPLPT